jgi:pantoate--beta-alanine ligase
LKVARTVAEMRALRAGTTHVGFVPTMGALHEGHVALMRHARAETSFVVMSLFVNPTQFGPNEDLSRYPRQEARDCELAAAAGVDVAFIPSPDEVYRSTAPTMIHVPSVSERWEGAARPGHFDGVATVVAKLFNMVAPDVAYFGRKDLQQCAVVAKLVADLDFSITLRFVETIREPDGLALSSRNAYLSPSARQRAPLLSGTLIAAAQRIRRRWLPGGLFRSCGSGYDERNRQAHTRGSAYGNSATRRRPPSRQYPRA